MHHRTFVPSRPYADLRANGPATGTYRPLLRGLALAAWWPETARCRPPPSQEEINGYPSGINGSGRIGRAGLKGLAQPGSITGRAGRQMCSGPCGRAAPRTC